MVHNEEEKYRERQEQRFPQHFCELPYTPDRVFPMMSPINPPMGKRLKLWTMHVICAWRRHPYTPIMRPSNYTIEMEQVVHVRSYFWWLIHPLSRFWMIWTLIVSITNIVVLLLVPVYQGFLHTRRSLAGYNGTGELPTVSWLDDSDPVTNEKFNNQREVMHYFESVIGCCETVFLLHVIITFITGYLDMQQNNVIMDQPSIIRRYTLTWFVPDIVSAIPIEAFNQDIGYFGQEDHINYLDPHRRYVLYIYVVIYTSRLLRLHEIYHTLKMWCWYCSLSSIYTHFFFYAIFFILYIQWSTYYVVRIPFLVEGPWLFSPKCRSWIADPVNEYLLLNRTFPLTRQYFSALHRVFEVSGAFSPFSSRNTLAIEDVIVMCVVMYLAKIFNLVLFALIMRYIGVNGMPFLKFNKILSEVGTFGRARRLPLPLRERFVLYYKHRFELYYYNVKSIMNSFTSNLRRAVIQHECRRVVQYSPLFRGLPKGMLNHVAANLIEDFYLPNDVIYPSGSEASYLYFLSIGTVGIYLHTGEEIGHLEDGDYFGIMGVILPEYNKTHIETIVALENCEVFKLPFKYLSYVMNRMPRLFARCRSAAMTRAMDMAPLLENLRKDEESTTESEKFSSETDRESTSSLDSDILRELEGFLV